MTISGGGPTAIRLENPEADRGSLRDERYNPRMTLSAVDAVAVLIPSAVGAGLGSYVTAYLKKGENLATHEDIQETIRVDTRRDRHEGIPPSAPTLALARSGARQGPVSCDPLRSMKRLDDLRTCGRAVTIGSPQCAEDFVNRLRMPTVDHEAAIRLMCMRDLDPQLAVLTMNPEDVGTPTLRANINHTLIQGGKPSVGGGQRCWDRGGHEEGGEH
jgi:hypothetical protein